MAMGGAIRTWSGLYWERALGAEAVVPDRGVHGGREGRCSPGTLSPPLSHRLPGPPFG